MADKWYYNSRSGAVQHKAENVMWLDLHAGEGWHGPFDTNQAALDYYTQNKANNPGWKAPSGLLENITNATGVTSATDTIKSGLGLNDTNIRSWLIRIGEIVLGIVLIGIGMAKLTGTTNVIAKAAKASL